MSDFSEKVETWIALATSAHSVLRKLPPSALCGALPIECSTPSRPSTCSLTLSASESSCSVLVTSSSMTGAGCGSRLAIRCTSVGRGNAVSTSVAPSCCATRAAWKAIEASVSTPVTRIRLPSRMPI